MAIEFPCSGCEAVLKVADASAGKKCKCPNCSSVNVVPAATAEVEEDEVEAPRKVKSAKRGVATEPLPRVKKKARPLDEDDEADGFDEDATEDEEERKPKKGTGKKAKGKSKKGGGKKGLIIGGAIGLGLCLLLCGGGTVGLGYWYFRSGAAEDIRYYPNNAQAVETVHVDQITNSAVFKEIAAAGGQNNEFANLENQYGIPSTNIDRYSTARTHGPSPESITVVRTKTPVQAGDISAKLKGADAKVTFSEAAVGNFKINEPSTPPGAPGIRNAFCLIDSKTVVYGQGRTVRSVLERNKAPELSAGMQAVMKKADFSRSQTRVEDFSDGNQQMVMPGMGMGFGQFGPGKQFDNLVEEVQAGSDLSVHAAITFKDPASATAAKKEMDDNLQMTKNNPLMKPFADIQVTSTVSGSTLTTDVKIDGKTLAKLVGMGKR
jgi:phage FluMu protein Com